MWLGRWIHPIDVDERGAFKFLHEIRDDGRVPGVLETYKSLWIVQSGAGE